MPTVEPTKNAEMKTPIELLADELASENLRHNEALADIQRRMLEETRKDVHSVTDHQKGKDSDDQVDGTKDSEQVAASFEEPDEADLKAALDNIKSRFGLSVEEYEERYSLQNVDTEKITFTTFKKRLEEAPTEKRVHFVNAWKAKRELVPFRINERGEFGLMNPRQINKALVNREFNAWGAEQNGRDPEQSIVSILRSEGMEPATKTDALHVTALHADKCENVFWLCLAERDNMTPEELDKAQWAGAFYRERGRARVDDFCAHLHIPGQSGLGVLWI